MLGLERCPGARWVECFVWHAARPRTPTSARHLALWTVLVASAARHVRSDGLQPNGDGLHLVASCLKKHPVLLSLVLCKTKQLVIIKTNLSLRLCSVRPFLQRVTEWSKTYTGYDRTKSGDRKNWRNPPYRPYQVSTFFLTLSMWFARICVREASWICKELEAQRQRELEAKRAARAKAGCRLIRLEAIAIRLEAIEHVLEASFKK